MDSIMKKVSEFFEKHPDAKTVMVQRAPTASETAAAVRVLQLSMFVDHEFAWGWHCNIAMSFFDEMKSMRELSEHPGLPKIANRAAARFMKTCFDVDVREFEQWKALGID